MLYGDAMANLGQAPDPMSGRPHIDLEQARFAIDLLAMLQDKTRGNRTPDESAVLEEMLDDPADGVRAAQPGAARGPLGPPPPGPECPRPVPGRRVWMTSRPGWISTCSTTRGIRHTRARGRPPTTLQNNASGIP